MLLPKKITLATIKEHEDQVCLNIWRLFFKNGISFNGTRSPFLVSMLRSIWNYGQKLKVPTKYEM